MARSYLPSKVSDIVAIWRKDLNKVTYFGFLFPIIQQLVLVIDCLDMYCLLLNEQSFS